MCYQVKLQIYLANPFVLLYKTYGLVYLSIFRYKIVKNCIFYVLLDYQYVWNSIYQQQFYLMAVYGLLYPMKKTVILFYKLLLKKYEILVFIQRRHWYFSSYCSYSFFYRTWVMDWSPVIFLYTPADYWPRNNHSWRLWQAMALNYIPVGTN